MDAQTLLTTQRTLRHRFLEAGGTPRAGRDLVAEMLLYLDQPQTCWDLATRWLRQHLQADRVDGGYGGYVGANGHAQDYRVQAEDRRASLGLPPVRGLVFSARDPGLQVLWPQRRLMAITQVDQHASMSAELRHTLRQAGTSAKLAFALRDGLQPVGLICADWHQAAPRWQATRCDTAWQLANDTLGPLLAASQRMSQSHRTLPAGWADLTAAEQRVARLVATGQSYKEVARQLGRSLSTVDHQLRSVRHKLGLRSTARLVHLLNTGETGDG